jgi:hypothetical protein
VLRTTIGKVVITRTDRWYVRRAELTAALFIKKNFYTLLQEVVLAMGAWTRLRAVSRLPQRFFAGSWISTPENFY